MTDQELKDQFACAAMQEFLRAAFAMKQGFWGAFVSGDRVAEQCMKIPDIAYDMAEEMMQERAKRL